MNIKAILRQGWDLAWRALIFCAIAVTLVFTLILIGVSIYLRIQKV